MTSLIEQTAKNMLEEVTSHYFIEDRELEEDADALKELTALLTQYTEEVLGKKPDLERLKDKSYSDNDRLWWEAVWDTQRRQYKRAGLNKD